MMKKWMDHLVSLSARLYLPTSGLRVCRPAGLSASAGLPDRAVGGSMFCSRFFSMMLIIFSVSSSSYYYSNHSSVSVEYSYHALTLHSDHSTLTLTSFLKKSYLPSFIINMTLLMTGGKDVNMHSPSRTESKTYAFLLFLTYILQTAT
jgi:hypothetical protein